MVLLVTALVIFTAVSSLLDAGLVATRLSQAVLNKNVVASIVRVVALLLLVSFPKSGLLTAYGLGLLVATMLGSISLSRRVEGKPAGSGSLRILRRYLSITSANYIASILGDLPVSVVPIEVLVIRGAAEAGRFAVAFLIAGFLSVIPSTVAQVLFAETSRRGITLGVQLRKAIRGIYGLLLPILLIVVLVAPLLLRIFGEAYAAAATGCLRVLALSTLLMGGTYLVDSLLIARDRIAAYVFMNGANAALVLGLVGMMLPRGLTAAACGWALAQGLSLLLGLLMLAMARSGRHRLGRRSSRADNRRRHISIEQHEPNMARLDANRSGAQNLGAVRDGPALLAGLVVCGQCGSKMTVRYQHGPGGTLHSVYVCSRDKSDYASDQCQQLAGPRVDAHVTGLLLAAVAPPALDVSPTAAGQAEARRGQMDRIWRQRLERADYQAERTWRQYQLAEPENQLVARQLEKDWGAALAERRRLGGEYDRFTAAHLRTPNAAERWQIRAQAADLPAVWDAPTTTDTDRKQLIRNLVEQVRVTVLGTREKVDVEIVWAGGHRTRGQITRPAATRPQLSYYPQLAARARELAGSGCTTAQIAERLNAEGFCPPKGIAVFTPSEVSDLLQTLGIQRSHVPARRPPLAQHQWWLHDLAAHLGMPQVTLDSWIRRGWAAGYLHPQARQVVVRADPAEVERLRAQYQVPRGQHNRRPG